MRTTLIYDLPSRLFHWMFAALFLFSFAIANVVDDESVLFIYHMLLGLLMGALILWRIYWGIFGTKHARFTNFTLNPLALKDYFLGIVSGSTKRWPGHNPASSWATILMLFLGLGLCFTGYLMTTGDKEVYEDIHELMANAFLATVLLHIAGVLLHSVRHKDGIALSMLDANKENIENEKSIGSQRIFSAITLLLLMALFGSYLYKNYNSSTSTLTIFGNTLILGENENGQSGEDDDDD
jgi:cytochrome b